MVKFVSRALLTEFPSIADLITIMVGLGSAQKGGNKEGRGEITFGYHGTDKSNPAAHAPLSPRVTRKIKRTAIFKQCHAVHIFN